MKTRIAAIFLCILILGLCPCENSCGFEPLPSESVPTPKVTRPGGTGEIANLAELGPPEPPKILEPEPSPPKPEPSLPESEPSPSKPEPSPAEEQNRPAGVWGSPFRLVANNGKSLKHCVGCGPGGKDIVTANGEKGDPLCVWNAIVVGSQLAIKTSNGKFMVRRDGGWQGTPQREAIFCETLQDPAQDEFAVWSSEVHGQQYALRSKFGKYLAVCNNCGSGDSPVFAHMTWPDEPAKWRVEAV